MYYLVEHHNGIASNVPLSPYKLLSQQASSQTQAEKQSS